MAMEIPGSPSGSTYCILIIDDDPEETDALEQILNHTGYTDVVVANDSRRALPLFREVQPDLVVLDMEMPHLDGLHVLKLLRNHGAGEQFLPILVITETEQRELRHQALQNGGNDHLVRPFSGEEVALRLRNLLEMRELHRDLDDQVRQKTTDLKQAEIEIARRLAAAAELRDYGGEEHTQRVGRISARIARAMGLPQREVEVIRHAAPLHDIGKIAIPDEILLKPDALTLEELEVMKQHTTIGARALTGSRSRILQMAEEIALYHHENWDGTGYTPGLAGEEIPVFGRIVAAADCFDALVSDRPYKKAWPKEDAIESIQEQRASKFDPAVVDALLSIHATGELAEAQLPDTESFRLFDPLPAL